MANRLFFFIAATLLTQPLAAEMRPHVMDAAYTEPEAPKLEPGEQAPAPIPQTCKIALVEVADVRDPQGYMGNWFDQPFHPPADRAAWLKSMAMGLNKRGFDVKLAEAGAAPAGHLPVRVELKTGWINTENGGFQALAKLRLASLDPARPHDKTYRGSFWRTVFMATVGGRSNDAWNGAVADGLDWIAEDRTLLCP